MCKNNADAPESVLNRMQKMWQNQTIRIDAQQKRQLHGAAAMAAAFMLCFSLFLSACFLAEELHHDCAGEDCPVCACLQLCENQVRRVGAGCACVAVFYAFALLVLVQQASILFLPALTPISQKVRLDR